MTEVPITPKNWKWARINQITEHDAPVMYGILQPGEDIPKGVPYVRPTEIENDIIQLDKLRRTSTGISNRYRRSSLAAGDILLSIVGTIGKVAIVPELLQGGNITQSSVRIRGNSKLIDKQYLAFALRSPVLRRQFDAKRLGTAVPRLNVAHVRELVVPLAPLSEQCRIVAKIEELFSDLDAGVANLLRVRAKLKRYRAAVLKAAVEGKLTEDWRAKHPVTEPASVLLERILTERRRKWEEDQLANFEKSGRQPPKGWHSKYQEPVEPDLKSVPNLPHGWGWIGIEQLNSAARPISYGVLQPGDNVENGIPLIRVCDVVDGIILIDQLKRIEPRISAQYQRTILQGGEVLITVVGTIGRTAVVPNSLCGVNIARAVAVIPLLDAVDARYFEALLPTEWVTFRV